MNNPKATGQTTLKEMTEAYGRAEDERVKLESENTALTQENKELKADLKIENNKLTEAFAKIKELHDGKDQLFSISMERVRENKDLREALETIVKGTSEKGPRVIAQAALKGKS